MKHYILNLPNKCPLYFDGETLQKLGNQDAASGCGEKRRICRDAFEPSPRLFLTARIRRSTQWVMGRKKIYIYNGYIMGIYLGIYMGIYGIYNSVSEYDKISWGYNEPKWGFHQQK